MIKRFWALPVIGDNLTWGTSGGSDSRPGASRNPRIRTMVL